jgi:hypothetical protein
MIMKKFKLLQMFIGFCLLSLQGCENSNRDPIITKNSGIGMAIDGCLKYINPFNCSLSVLGASPFIAADAFDSLSKKPKVSGGIKEKEKEKICMYAYNNITERWTEYSHYQSYVKEAKRLGLDCGITEEK